MTDDLAIFIAFTVTLIILAVLWFLIFRINRDTKENIDHVEKVLEECRPILKDVGATLSVLEELNEAQIEGEEIIE